MIYQEYRVDIQGLEKRLGLLGESHIYTPRESEFARQIIDSYKNIGFEGVEMSSLLGELYDMAKTLAFVGSKKDLDHEMSWDIAKTLDKKTYNLEDTKLPLLTTAAFYFIFTVPILYASVLIPPLFVLNKVFNLVERVGKSQSSNSKIGRKLPKLLGLDYLTEGRNRSLKMARTAYGLLNEDIDDLLISCGGGHVPEIVEYLRNMTSLTRIDRQEIE